MRTYFFIKRRNCNDQFVFSHVLNSDVKRFLIQQIIQAVKENTKLSFLFKGRKQSVSHDGTMMLMTSKIKNLNIR